MSPFAIGAIITLGCAAYWPLHANGFIELDDPNYITANAPVLSGLTRFSLPWAFSTYHAANWHPLTWLSHMLDCQLWGVNPLAHHATNVAIHLATACLLFAALRSMTRAAWPSLIVALFFALHPVHVESVAWAAERKDVLAAFFGALSLYFYIRFVRTNHWLWYIAMVIAFALGLLSKPMLVALPFVFLLLDFWPLKRAFRWRLLGEKAPLFALALASCVMTYLAQKAGGAVARMDVWPIQRRVASALISYVRYLRLMFWPTKLAVFYPLSDEAVTSSAATSSLVALLAITLVAIWLRRRMPWILVGWLWFLGMMVPVIGLIQVGGQAIADRYLYLPSIGLTVAVVWTIADLCKNRITRSVALAAAAIVIVICGVLTFRQVRVWKNSATLMTHTLAVVSDNGFCRFYLGVRYALDGRGEDAQREFQHAIRIQPNYAPPYIGLARLDMLQARYNESLALLEKAARLKPSEPDIYQSIGDIRALQGQWREAASAYEQCLRLDPDQSIVAGNLAIALLQCGELDRAEAHLRKFLSYYPDETAQQYQLATVLFRQNRFDEAEAHLAMAVGNEPIRASQVQMQLAMLAFKVKNVDRATSRLREAVRLNPNFVPAVQDLAWILATHPDPAKRDRERAVALAVRANELSGGQIPELVDTLAAAYAANSQFDKAIAAAQQALSLAQRAGNTTLSNEIDQRLKLYRDGKPFVDRSLSTR